MTISSQTWCSKPPPRARDCGCPRFSHEAVSVTKVGGRVVVGDESCHPGSAIQPPPKVLTLTSAQFNAPRWSMCLWRHIR